VQRFAQFAEQPRILKGDDGLIGKRGDEFDLLLGESLDPASHQDQDADRPTFAQQRHAERGLNAFKAGDVGQLEFRVSLGVFDLNGSALVQHPTDN
jgi:hypothetical protein